MLRIEYEDLYLGVYGVSIEDGAIIGSLRDCGGRWAFELYDEGSGVDAFAQGQRMTKRTAQAAIRTAAIERIASTIY